MCICIEGTLFLIHTTLHPISPPNNISQLNNTDPGTHGPVLDIGLPLPICHSLPCFLIYFHDASISRDPPIITCTCACGFGGCTKIDDVSNVHHDWLGWYDEYIHIDWHDIFGQQCGMGSACVDDLQYE